jgi:hypothetical protein
MTKPKIKLPITTTTAPQRFNELVAWHMARGTRPDTGDMPQASWHSDRLAEAARCNGASVRNWRRGRFGPGARHLHGLANAFFGSTPSQQEARAIFLAAWKQACAEHRYNLLRIDKENPEAVRNHVVTQLSSQDAANDGVVLIVTRLVRRQVRDRPLQCPIGLGKQPELPRCGRRTGLMAMTGLHAL